MSLLLNLGGAYFQSGGHTPHWAPTPVSDSSTSAINRFSDGFFIFFAQFSLFGHFKAFKGSGCMPIPSQFLSSSFMHCSEWGGIATVIRDESPIKMG